MKKVIDDNGNMWEVKSFYELQSAMMKLIVSGKIKVNKNKKKGRLIMRGMKHDR